MLFIENEVGVLLSDRLRTMIVKGDGVLSSNKYTANKENLY